METDPALLLQQVGAVDREFCLILDDCHVLTNPSCFGLLNELITRLPDEFFVMLISRKRLPLPLGRLRSLGQVREIDASELRFTKDEAFSVMRRQIPAALPENELRQIWSAADGWITGIHLAVMSLRQVSDDGAGLNSRSSLRDAFLDDYVLQEVIAPLPPDLQEFVVATADFPYLSAELCDTALGTSDSAVMIMRLSDELAFINTMSEHSDRYRYNRMMHESIRRLAAVAAREQDSEAPRRTAVRYLIDVGELDAAAELALRSSDWSWIVEVMEPLCKQLADRSDLDLLGQWLERVPGTLLDANPNLAYWRIAAELARGRTVGIDELLDRAEPTWRSSGDTLQTGRASLCRGVQAFLEGDGRRVERWLIGALDQLPADALVERLYASTFLGQAKLRQGSDADAAVAFGEAESYAARLPIDEQWCWRVVAAGRANTYALRGDLYSAITKYRLMLSELPPYLRSLEGFLRCRLVSLAIERNDLETARQELDVIEQLKGDQPRSWFHDAAIARTRYLHAIGQRDEAEQWGSRYLRELRRLPEKNQLVLLLARIWLERGELPLVRSWVTDISSLLKYPWVQVFGDINYQTLGVDLDLAEENFEQAADAARRLTAEAEAAQRWSEFVGLSVRRAVALHQLGEVDQIPEILRPALERGVRGGFVRSFQVPGFNTAWMFADIWKESKDFLKVKRSLREASAMSLHGLSVSLSPRELEALRLVARGKSNRQIADRMFISTNTVRNHLVNIGHRLGTSSRVEAVARAREIGLLD